ncbi:MAG: hypothetical protein K0S09_1297 [Sphingobacteriaceae bacterium]|jgi:hypothetical protein|nr:hypothetical protein [Sphingobacteriaceae bacterium]
MSRLQILLLKKNSIRQIKTKGHIAPRNDMKKLFFLFLLLANITYAQTRNQQLTLKHPEEIYKYFGPKIITDTSMFNKLCVKTATMVCFKVTADGNIDSIDFTINTPDYIKDAMRKALLKTNGEWSFNASEKMLLPHKVFIIPYAIHFTGGCQVPSTEFSNDKKREKARSAPQHPFSKKMDDSFDMFGNLLNFEKKTYAALDCIILPPIIEERIVMY